MDANALLVLSAYSAAIFAASLLGGKLAALGTMTHTRTQIAMSLVAGFILGIAMFHLLPHSLNHMAGSDIVAKAVGWMVLGMVLMIFLLRIFHFHRHDFSREARDLYDDHDRGGHARSLFGVALGLGIHTATEGIALGASMRMEPPHQEGVALAGLGVFLAILLHKPLDAYSIIGIMKSAGHSQRTRAWANVGFAILCPMVAVASFGGVEWLGSEQAAPIGYVLSFAAGAFLCIALSDLLPEIHFHSHDRGKLIGSLLVGIGLAYALSYVESSAVHGHGMAAHTGP